MSLDYTKTQVYFRDNFLPFDQANLSIASSPVLYGLAVYTVFNAIWSESDQQLRIFRLHDHWQRLCRSARIMGFDDFSEDYPYDRFQELMLELLRRNTVKENVLVRASIFIDELIAGTRINGLRNSFSAYIYPMSRFYPEGGARVCVSSWRRLPDQAIPARAKVNGGYANSSLMKNEALLNGYDEAIALDERGHVTEGTVANIFLVRDGTLITPDRASDILEGITRDTIIALAEIAHIPVEQRPVDRSELYVAEEIFFSGSSAQVTPIISVDQRLVNNGQVGSVTSQFVELYARAQSSISPFPDWLTKVY